MFAIAIDAVVDAAEGAGPAPPIGNGTDAPGAKGAVDPATDVPIADEALLVNENLEKKGREVTACTIPWSLGGGCGVEWGDPHLRDGTSRNGAEVKDAAGDRIAVGVVSAVDPLSRGRPSLLAEVEDA